MNLLDSYAHDYLIAIPYVNQKRSKITEFTTVYSMWRLYKAFYS